MSAFDDRPPTTHLVVYFRNSSMFLLDAHTWHCVVTHDDESRICPDCTHTGSSCSYHVRLRAGGACLYVQSRSPTLSLAFLDIRGRFSHSNRLAGLTARRKLGERVRAATAGNSTRRGITVTITAFSKENDRFVREDAMNIGYTHFQYRQRATSQAPDTSSLRAAATSRLRRAASASSR